MGTNIQRYNLSAEDFGGKALEGCNDNLVLTRPDVIQAIHESFLAVGCDVVETCTFQSTPRRLREWGLGDKVREINVGAARLARAAADKYSTPDQPRFVAASMGPTGMLPSSSDPVLSQISYAELADNFYEQAKYLVEGGVDLLLIETSQDILEVKAAVAGIERLFVEIGRRLPIQTQVTLDVSGRMLLGTDIASAMTTLEALKVDVIGLNCSTGPEHMREPVRYLSEHATLPLSVIPNAGLPLNTGVGEAVYPLEPQPMATALSEFVKDFGVRIVGGCCGTTPEHLSAIVEAVREAERAAKPVNHAQHVPRVSSAMRAITLHQDPPPLLVGERVNAQGSRKVKRLLLADDYEGILEVAREQVDSGAHVLDVCVALTERGDEAEQMSKVVKLLSMSVETPLVIDSTEANVIEAALEHIPGRGIVNSINMENGRKRIDSVVPLVKKHGAAVIALTIDEIGMAKTRERKLEVAKKIYDIVVGEYGLAPEDLIYDALTFTLATGDAEWIDSGKETVEGIRLIKRELPGVSTILGVSNVSFGLTPEARGVLNSVFLHHCVQAGLDAAIVNPAHIRPYAEISAEEREMADDLVFNKTPTALQRFIEYFSNVGGGGAAAQVEKEDPTAGMTAEQKIHWMILHRKKEGIEEQLDAAGVRETPVRVLNEVLLPAMKEVGDKFGAGELILPFVLQSAEVMKKAVKHLELFLEKAEGYTKGKVVLATVYGDVHDIGKSLVNTILSNNGYTVFDLGKQVPVNTILDKAVEVGADAIGLSALLVSTSKQMPLCVQELDKRGMQIPVLIGGAAINRRFGRRALFVEGERAYDSGVFYCKDAFEGLETMDVLQDPKKRTLFVDKNLDDARNDVFLRTAVGKDIAVGDAGGRSQRCRGQQSAPVAAFLGHARHSRRSDRRSLRSARSRRALSPAVGCAWLGRSVQIDHQERIRARARAPEEGRKEERLDQATGGLRLFPRAVAGERRDHLRSRRLLERRRLAARDRALPLSAHGRPRAALSRRLYPQRRFGRRRCPSAPDRHRRQGSDEEIRGAAGEERVHRSVLLSRTVGRVRRSRSRVGAPPHQEGAERAEREEVLVGLRRVSRPRRPHYCVQAPPSEGSARHGSHRSVPDSSRAVDGRGRHPSSGSEVLRGSWRRHRRFD